MPQAVPDGRHFRRFENVLNVTLILFVGDGPNLSLDPFVGLKDRCKARADRNEPPVTVFRYTLGDLYVIILPPDVLPLYSHQLVGSEPCKTSDSDQGENSRIRFLEDLFELRRFVELDLFVADRLTVYLFSVVQTVMTREIVLLHAPVEEGFQICSIMVSSFGRYIEILKKEIDVTP